MKIQAVAPASYSTSNGENPDFWDGLINLAEVEFWNKDSQIDSSKLSAILSSYQDGYPSYLLFDHNYETFTSTNVDMSMYYSERASVTITVTDSVFDTIKVYNRPFVCQGRIRGANLTVYSGTSVAYSDTFTETKSLYIFKLFDSPTWLPTSSPTPGMITISIILKYYYHYLTPIKNSIADTMK